jgi:hypothetical protein
VAGCCECGDESSVSSATETVIIIITVSVSVMLKEYEAQIPTTLLQLSV